MPYLIVRDPATRQSPACVIPVTVITNRLDLS